MLRGPFVAALLVVSGCASWRQATPPERALFRIATTGVADGASADLSVPAKPSRQPGAAAVAASRTAYTTSVRIVHADGTVLTSPQLTAYAGQRATIQLLNQSAYVMDFDVEAIDDALIADPLIGMIHEGLSMDLVVVPARGAGEAAVGLRVTSASARKPHERRSLSLVGEPRPVTIELPRVETVELAGAHRVRLGVESEWARVPDSSGGADLRVLGRVDALAEETLAELDAEDRFAADRAREVGDDLSFTSAARTVSPDTENQAALRDLADLAATNAPQGLLRVRAVRMPRHESDPEQRGVDQLCEVAVRTVVGPGVRLADQLSRAYVESWNAREFAHAAAVPSDPRIGDARSGIAAEVASDGSLRVQWTTVSDWDHVSTTMSQGPSVSFDVPKSASAGAVVTPLAGRTVRPMFTLADGGTAAIVVEWEPDRVP
ncbi:MAG: hypothetical protein K8T90_02485 [Planctomycetes bacterium]|nr:hypothetical protein [Planctomycetota bacterium]